MAYVNNTTLNGLMTTAIEGGSAYWMNEPDDVNSVRIIRNKEVDVVEIECEHDVDGKGWKTSIINATNIRKALAAIKKDEKSTDYMKSFATKMLSDPDHDYDAGDADFVVQYAIFGEVVFG